MADVNNSAPAGADEVADPGATGFCAEAWQRGADIRDAVVGMPFVTQLADGSLAKEAFRHYLIQDSFYLRAYSRALSIASSKAHTPNAQVFLAESAASAVTVEMSLHRGFLARSGVTEADLANGESSPTCDGYVNHLLANAHTRSYPVLLAALLPCFWLYMHVGVQIAKAAAANPRSDHPYQEWIDMYSGDGFAHSVRKMQLLCNEVAAQCTPAQLEEMMDAYMRAARYEWMFFDAAHRLERWPLALGGM